MAIKTAKKKLQTNPDGTLNYPLEFNLGDLVEFQDDIHGVSKGYGGGIGVVTEIQPNTVKVYWQSVGKYIDYTVAAAVLSLKLIK